MSGILPGRALGFKDSEGRHRLSDGAVGGESK